MKIVFLEPLGIPEDNLKNRIETKVSNQEIIYHKDRKEDNATLIERSKDADIIVLSNIKLTKEVLVKCKNLKMICVAFTGYDHIDIEFCKENSIEVCNASGYSTVAVADIVFAMVLNLARNILPCDKVCRTEGTKDGLVGFELAGKTFGIIGYGEIGKRVAMIANAFGCNVLVHSRTVKDDDTVKFVDKKTLLEESDIVSLHIPQNPQTLNFIDQEELKKMKKSAILINTARGPVVNSTALAQALEIGEIAGAGIDVFETEPPISREHVLLHSKNTLVTPHIAFASHQAFEKRANIVAENIKSYILGDLKNKIV